MRIFAKVASVIGSGARGATTNFIMMNTTGHNSNNPATLIIQNQIDFSFRSSFIARFYFTPHVVPTRTRSVSYGGVRHFQSPGHSPGLPFGPAPATQGWH